MAQKMSSRQSATVLRVSVGLDWLSLDYQYYCVFQIFKGRGVSLPLLPLADGASHIDGVNPRLSVAKLEDD